MKFRLFRSRAFWFGVLGLVFLLWGWRISLGYWSGVSYGQVMSAWETGQVGGKVYVHWDLNGWPDGGELNAGHDLFPAEEAHALKEDWAKLSKAAPNCRFVLIPYYWLVLCYLMVWAGLVFWRSRKYRALKEGAVVE